MKNWQKEELRKMNTQIEPESKGYLSLGDIPPEVLQAAKTLNDFFDMKGMTHWQFSYVADRRLVNRLERENEELKSRISTLINEWLEVAEIVDNTASREQSFENALIAKARAGAIRGCISDFNKCLMVCEEDEHS